jgi:hypothetical protein
VLGVCCWAPLLTTVGVFAIGSTPGSTNGALGSFPTARGASRGYCSGPRRPRWCASRRPNSASCERRRRGLCCALATHVPLVHDAALALRLSRALLSGSHHNAIVYHARAPRSATCSTRGCGTFSPTASGLSDCCAFLPHTRSRSALSDNHSSDAAECVGEQRQQRQRRRPAPRTAAGKERQAHDYQLKANLFVTARRMVRVSRDALTSELLSTSSTASAAGVASPTTRRCASACSSTSSSWRHCCRDVQSLHGHGMHAVLNSSGPCSDSRRRSATPEPDQLPNSASRTRPRVGVAWWAFDDARLLNLKKQIFGSFEV